MAKPERWVDVGAAEDIRSGALREVKIDGAELALSCRDGVIGAISNVCNHVGGPLGQGRLEATTSSAPGISGSFTAAPGSASPVSSKTPCRATPCARRRAACSSTSPTARRRSRLPHAPHPLKRDVVRAPGPLRLAGIGTTAMDLKNPRFSGSDHLLGHALREAAALGAETRMISLNALKFRNCEGYYSKAARACTWPCSITEMDAADQMDQVYEALVHWADAVIVATPIRWGAASALYFKMAERLNCVQNAVTVSNRVLIRNKVAGFIVVGGQDNIQAVAGQMMGFFAELGFLFPQFPYVAHSRGWSHEDMERNVEIVRDSEELKNGAEMLAKRCLDFAAQLVARDEAAASIERGGRKAHAVAPAGLGSMG